eukprot:TRINITY_DN411_c3_g1_i3.p1 TRINITY_DN411_c3_g1~~TRINITY_DN411_c3_g1_i3.p1  ORF type:complete len:315 (-),score=33.30 TRINITY_DN411_c3_g1_i3:35-979(-)
METFIHLMKWFKENHSISKLILSLWYSMCKHMLDSIPEGDQEIFLNHTINLFTAFKECGFAKVMQIRSKPNKLIYRVLEQEHQERVLLAIKILLEISEQRLTRSAKTSYFGISCIVDTVNVELLQYPMISEKFYSLITSLFVKHTDKLLLIPHQLLQGLLYHIKRAIENDFTSASNVNHCLISLTHLLTLHIKEPQKGVLQRVSQEVQTLSQLFMNFLLAGEKFQQENLDASADLFYAFMLYDRVDVQNKINTSLSSVNSNLIIPELMTQLMSTLFFNVPEITTSLGFGFSAPKQFNINFTKFLIMYRNHAKQN